MSTIGEGLKEWPGKGDGPSLTRLVHGCARKGAHIGNGDLSSKCVLRNLVIKWRREDELLQRDLEQMPRRKNAYRNK